MSNFKTGKKGSELLIKKSLRDDVFHKNLESLPECGLPNSPAFMYIVGRPGSGKSLMLESLFSKQYCIGKGKQTAFDRIFYFTPKTSEGSYEKSFVQDLDRDRIYNELNVDNFLDVIEEVEDLNPEGLRDKWGRKVEPKYSCIIFDDMISELSSSRIKPIIGKIGKNFRHLRLLIIIVSQNYILLPKTIRDNVSHLIQYNTSNKLEKERLMFEYFGEFSRKEFEVFWEYCFREKYSFIIANRRSDTYHVNFAPLEYTPPEGEDELKEVKVENNNDKCDNENDSKKKT